MPRPECELQECALGSAVSSECDQLDKSHTPWEWVVSENPDTKWPALSDLGDRLQSGGWGGKHCPLDSWRGLCTDLTIPRGPGLPAPTP